MQAISADAVRKVKQARASAPVLVQRRRGDSGLTTLEWLLIVAAVAGLAAVAVVLVQRVVTDTGEQIAGNDARIAASRVTASQISDKAHAAGLVATPAPDVGAINDDGKKQCDRLMILYSEAEITTNYTPGALNAGGTAWNTEPECEVTAQP